MFNVYVRECMWLCVCVFKTSKLVLLHANDSLCAHTSIVARTRKCVCVRERERVRFYKRECVCVCHRACLNKKQSESGKKVSVYY